MVYSPAEKMAAISPYLNPDWPDAVWDVSGAFVNDRELVAFHDFCKLLLGFEPFNIVHGSPLCTWNSGRVLKHLMRDAEEIRAAGLEYEKRNIAMYYTFTNLNLKEEHMKDPLGNAMLVFAISGGEQQRVALARALANNPKVIIADEPTGNIDPKMSLEIMSLLVKINKLGKTVIVVTHEKNLVDYYKQRVVSLRDGLIVEDRVGGMFSEKI